MSAYGPQPLLGLDRELAELHAALRSAESGKGALVLLVGEPGIGKTRLASDFANEAGARGAQVTWGRAQRRLEDLREAEGEATKHGDTHRATRVREEIEALASALAQGVGLGGRGRKASSTAEKARINVRKRILDAISRIREHSPALARHLERSVRTGNFCGYDP